MTATQLIRRTKPAVFLVCLGPALVLAWDAFTGGLSVNPIEDITHRSGTWALRFVLVTLAVTPIRWLSGWNGVISYRRMAGLFAFFYATLHFTTYLVFDHFFDVIAIAEDVVERKYVTAGFLGFVLMIPLAVTSTRGWIRRLGKRWTSLHRLIYITAIAGVVHFLWVVKLETGEPLIYAAGLVVLFGARGVRRYATRPRPRRAPAGERVPSS